jgi:hypothetical protein
MCAFYAWKRRFFRYLSDWKHRKCHGQAVGANLRPAGLPFDRSITVRPVSYRSTGQLPFDRPVAVRPVNYRSTGRSPFDRSVTVRPGGRRSTGQLPFDRSITVRPVNRRSTGQTGRPAGPVRSDFFRPVPVPVVKNPDRFHLCRIPCTISQKVMEWKSLIQLKRTLFNRRRSYSLPKTEYRKWNHRKNDILIEWNRFLWIYFMTISCFLKTIRVQFINLLTWNFYD